MHSAAAGSGAFEATGWVRLGPAAEWSACHLVLADGSVTVEIAPKQRLVISLGSIVGVDDLGDAPAGHLTVELRSTESPPTVVCCPEAFISTLVESLRGLQQAAATPPGWYATDDAAVLRWWDGTGWTEHYSNAAASPVAEPASVAPTPADAATTAVVAEVAAVWDAQPAGRPGSKKALEAEVERLRGALAAMGVAEQAELSRQLEQTRAAITEQRSRADQAIAERRTQVESELAARRSQVDRDLAARTQEVERRLAVLRDEVDRFQRAAATARESAMEADAALVRVREEAILQEVGIYDYRHRLEDSPAYRARLDALRLRIKEMGKKDGGAINARSDWTVNGSATEGRRMVSELSRLMLRAYNGEADRLVQTMRPYKLDSAVDRLNKSKETISKLGKTMSVNVSPAYHQLRIAELELTADFLAKVEEEKEAEREEKQRLRDEAAARREFEAEKARLLKEQAHYQRALEKMLANGDAEAVADAQAKLAEIGDAIEGVERREANHRAGYVYVISNVGSFGEKVVKIGMTRRLDPMDRVRELGDASVPFRYDVHAIVFSDDAVTLEQRLHHDLAPSRVNLVNLRREFFYATPSQVRELLERHEGSLLSFNELPEAEEWHVSQNSRPPGALR